MKNAVVKPFIAIVLLIAAAVILYKIKCAMSIDLFPHRHMLIFKE